MYKESWYDKLNRKFGRFAISNLMNIIICGMAVVFLVDMFVFPVTGLSLSSFLAFDKYAVMHGQIWRLITFIFIPPDSSLFFILFSLYFYWLIGNTLENEWGSFRFNLFYLIGMIGTVIAGFITGYATNEYINMTLFFAFACLYPDYELLVFFVLPLKIKYLAILDGIGMLFMFITNGLSGKIAILVALANFLIFFGGDFINMIKDYKRRRDYMKKIRN